MRKRYGDLRQSATAVGEERRAPAECSSCMGRKIAHFLAIALTATAMVPGGAHLFSLAAKMGLAQDPYFTVQQIYRGWALFGIAIFGALFANLAVAVFVRRQRLPFRLALAAALLILASLAVFFTWTYPANLATSNWTMIPPNWSDLRVQWEYSHAANAVVTFAALCSAVLAQLTAHDETA
jgi:ABC-type cobalamin transport system permease subunit